jgi:hypothetical protein
LEKCYKENSHRLRVTANRVLNNAIARLSAP